MIVDDFKEIRANMLGDNKPQPRMWCHKCEDAGWVYRTDLDCYGFRICPRCENPESRPCP